MFVHQTDIHAEKFRALSAEEPVEFEVVTDQAGKPRAMKVTGPGGAFVKGVPPRVIALTRQRRNRAKPADGAAGAAAPAAAATSQ